MVINARIANGDDLLAVLLTAEALRHASATSIELFITYLLGARMDRRIGVGEPFTLAVVADCLRGKFDRIAVLDPHSDVACALLGADAVSPIDYVREAVTSIARVDALCAPDAGSSKKVEAYAAKIGEYPIVQCLKHRDSKTGKLSDFRVVNDVVPERVLIVDDICDGGGTFVAVAEKLRARGAKWIGFYATHGIFSKGFEIPGIDQIFTTTSYRKREEYHKVIVVGPDLW